MLRTLLRTRACKGSLFLPGPRDCVSVQCVRCIWIEHFFLIFIKWAKATRSCGRPTLRPPPQLFGLSFYFFVSTYIRLRTHGTKPSRRSFWKLALRMLIHGCQFNGSGTRIICVKFQYRILFSVVDLQRA